MLTKADFMPKSNMPQNEGFKKYKDLMLFKSVHNSEQD